MGNILICLILTLVFSACGKHEISNTGFTKETKAAEGDKLETPEQFMKNAIEQGDQKLFVKLLAEGYEINALLANGRTALIHSVFNDKTLFVSILLEKGADVTIADGDGKTALDVAVELQRDRIALMLNPAKQVEMQTEMFGYIFDDIDDVDPQVDRLLKSGTNPNFIDPESGETALTMAIKNLSNAGVRLINWMDPDFGVTMTDVNMPNAEGKTPLAVALALPNQNKAKKYVNALKAKNALEVVEIAEPPEETKTTDPSEPIEEIP